MLEPINHAAACRLLMGLALLVTLSCNSDDDSRRTWSVYKADAASTSYSPLSQINRDNVHLLTQAWAFDPDDAAGSRSGNAECNPIVVDDVMYLTSGRHRLYALHADSGTMIWSHDAFDSGEGGGVNRGVAYWENGNDKRILYTAGNNLYAIDALTGTPVSGFGNQGVVSLNEGLRGDPATISVTASSPGIVFGDLLIVGGEVSELYGAEPGDVRAYDIPSGALIWTFHTIPHPGEFGYETWPPDAWKYAGGANDWGGMSVDATRKMVFLALGSPTYDFYGADRKGENLFGNCIVALDATTGKYLWHFQTVHHDLWDYDLPAPPNLVTVRHNGKMIDAVAQTTKSGFIFLLDRDTGKPLFPVEERPVPASHVPGEEAWPTQPFPTKPPPYARQFMTSADLSDFSPRAHDSLVNRFNALRYDGLFTPPDLRGTLVLPGTRGGSNWGGGAVDPETAILYVKSNDSPEIDYLRKIDAPAGNSQESLLLQGKAIYATYCSTCHGKNRDGVEDMGPSLLTLGDMRKPEETIQKIMQGSGRMPAFSSILAGKEKAILTFLYDREETVSSRLESNILEIHANDLATNEAVTSETEMYLNTTAYGHFRDIDGNPGIKPPWGTLNAIDLNTGAFAWSIPVGNHPELQSPGDPPTGSAGSGGPIVTAGGLVFIASTYDRKFRAFDKRNGSLLWEADLPGVGNATPSTYWSKGRQFVAVSVSGTREHPASLLLSFALPE
jgi:quinoprotein glucose dehydrogenase